MKKLIVFLITCVFVCHGALAADTVPTGQLPIDPELRCGVLPNGMTYYIRHNSHPSGHANFQIFHRVGALEEADYQNGLAHFLEHLAFNGLQHFPGKSMLDYMERIGVKFGSDVNAATSQEYTQYMLNNVPIGREGVVDTCLLVLHDWSGFIGCDSVEIEAERGVIQEERRGRGGSRLRIGEAITQIIYKDSKYALRNVIGNATVVDTFRRQDLLDFYHKWYYPQMQAVAIVGDFDVDQMEQKVKCLFSTIPAGPASLKKEHYLLPDNEGVYFKTYTDKEAMQSSVDVLFKHPALSNSERNTRAGYQAGYYRYLTSCMMNNRVHDLFKNGTYPAQEIEYGYDGLCEGTDVFSMNVGVRKGAKNILPAVEMLFEETERLRRYGFTTREMERVKVSARRQVEKAFLERDKATHSSFSKTYLSHFLKNNPALSPQDRYTLQNELLDAFTVEEANRLVKLFFTDRNIVSFAISNTEEQAGLPTEKQMKQYVTSMKERKVEPYQEKALPKSLLEKKPIPGKVLRSEKLKFGAVKWTLSNGANVYVLPKDCNKDEIQMTLTDLGGTSLVNDADYISSLWLPSVLMNSGAGRFSATELAEMLAGKIVYVNPFLTERNEMFDCSSSSTDYESMLQVVYLYFTEPRFDREALERNKAEVKEQLIARKADPFTALVDTLTYVQSNYHKRSVSQLIDPADVDKVDLEKIKQIYYRHFNNPADFKWVFTGAIDTLTFKPMVEQYIGSLPATHHQDRWVDVGKRPPLKPVILELKQPMETPKSTTFIEYNSSKLAYSFRQSCIMQLIQGILDIRFNLLLREEKSGTYSVDTEGSIAQFPEPYSRLIVSFTTRTDLMDELRQVTFDEFQRLAKEGVSEEDLTKSREYMYKILTQNEKETLYWHAIFSQYVRYGMDNYTDRLEILDSITPEEVRKSIEIIVNDHRLVSLTLRPE